MDKHCDHMDYDSLMEAYNKCGLHIYNDSCNLEEHSRQNTAISGTWRSTGPTTQDFPSMAKIGLTGHQNESRDRTLKEKRKKNVSIRGITVIKQLTENNPFFMEDIQYSKF